MDAFHQVRVPFKLRTQWLLGLGMVSATLLSACGSVPSISSFHKAIATEMSTPTVKDFVTREELAKITLGMNPNEVRAKIGPPMMTDPLDPNRWDYVVKDGTGAREEFVTYAVIFKDAGVQRIAAVDKAPTATAAAQQNATTAVADANLAASTAPQSADSFANSSPNTQTPMVPEPVQEMAAAQVPVGYAPTPEATQSAPPASQGVSDVDLAAGISEMLGDWAKAWSGKDVEGYLGFYAENFEHGTKSRKAWETERRSRLAAPANISVTLSDIRVNFISENEAQVRFRQEYASNKFKDVGRKVLTLVRQGNSWRIQKEQFSK